MIFCKNKNKTETENGETECGTKLKKTVCVCLCLCTCYINWLRERHSDTIHQHFFAEIKMRRLKLAEITKTKPPSFRQPGSGKYSFACGSFLLDRGAKQHRDADNGPSFEFFLVSFSSSTRHSRLIYIQIQKQSHFDTFFAKKMMTTCFFLQNSHNNGEPARRETGESTAAEFQISRQFFFLQKKATNEVEQLNESFVL